MGTFDHLQRKSPLASTPAIQAPSLLRPSRQFAPLPLSPTEHDAPVTQAQPGRARPLEYSFDRIPIFPPAKKNDTGLPDTLKAGVENLSGMPLDDVHVHYNSSKPAQIQALAYTQGTEIHMGPGQEQHLAHEAWHVVQQRRGRVKPTAQAAGVAINGDQQLEKEADETGENVRQQRVERQSFAPLVSLGPTVIQLVTDPPALIIVYFKDGKVVEVKNPAMKPLPFVLADTAEGTLLEGTVVLMVSGVKVEGARFAKTDLDATEISKLAKIPKIVTEVMPSEEQGNKPSSSTKVPAAVSAKTKLRGSQGKQESEIKASKEGELFNEPISFVGFEESAKSQSHLEKHGIELGVSTMPQYLTKARAFGAEGQQAFCEAIIDKTKIKVDPEGQKLRRVMIVNGRKLRTFYVWDPMFSSDPFTYAIYYTITSAKKMPLRDLDPKILALLKEQGVDLFAMETEEVDRQLMQGRKLEAIEYATKAPRELIEGREKVIRFL